MYLNFDTSVESYVGCIQSNCLTCWLWIEDSSFHQASIAALMCVTWNPNLAHVNQCFYLCMPKFSWIVLYLSTEGSIWNVNWNLPPTFSVLTDIKVEDTLQNIFHLKCKVIWSVKWPIGCKVGQYEFWLKGTHRLRPGSRSWCYGSGGRVVVGRQMGGCGAVS